MEENSKLSVMDDIRKLIKRSNPNPEESQWILDEMYENRRINHLRKTRYKNMWNELKQLLKDDGSYIEVLKLMDELEKQTTTIKDVFADNRDKIIELAESNTVKNKDGLTVLTDEEMKQSMNYRKRSWERD